LAFWVVMKMFGSALNEIRGKSISHLYISS
jgi:hypothetical protein